MHMISQRRKTGYLLPIAFAIMAILVTLVFALNFQASSSKVVRQLATAQIQAEQGVQNGLALLGQELQGDPVPGASTIGMSKEFDFDAGLDPRGSVDGNYVYIEAEGLQQSPSPDDAEKLFTGLPGAGVYEGGAVKRDLHGNDTSVYPWCTRVSMQPDSRRRDFSVFGERRYEANFHAGFPMAAYAPNGSVTLDSLHPWSNPTIKEKKKDPGQRTQEMFSGLSPWVGAKSSIKVDEFPYGEAYVKSKTGSFDIKGGAIAYRGLPMSTGNADSYEQLLLQDIDVAYNNLRTRAIDKTGLIWGKLTLTTVIDLIKGEEFPNLFSLENALSFYMPTIPFIKSESLWVELRFHVPLPPDQNLENVANQLQGRDKYEDVVKDLNKAEGELKVLEDRLAKAKSDRRKYAAGSDEYKDLTSKIDDLNNKIKDKKKEIEGYQEKLTGAADDGKDFFEDSVAAGTIQALRALPESRQDEIDAKSKGLTKKHWTGFSYIMFFLDRITDLADIIVTLVEGIFNDDVSVVDSLLKFMFKEVRLVHLGEGKPEPRPLNMFHNASNTFAIDKTINVPPGRSFRFGRNMHLRGDVWVQKGATMVVDGDLTLEKNSGAEVFAGNGRIYLEQGATLCVGGDLEAGGDSNYGSVVMCGPVGKMEPITAAIICQGAVNLPYGTRTGITLEDLAGFVGEEAGAPEMRQSMEVLMTDILPNVSKMLGPFHMRYCYFARWCTTISIPKFFPVPIPTPIPDNKHKNYMTLVFRGLTTAFTAHLNFTLGENLMTSCDWWIFGKERIPVIPKVDPYTLESNVTSVVNRFKDFVSDSDKVEDTLKTLGEDMIVKLVTDMLKPLLVDFIANQVIQGAIDALSPVAGFIYQAAAADEVDQLLSDTIDSIYDPLMNGLISELDLKSNGSVDDLFEKVKNEIVTATADVLLPESPGVLVYGKDSLEIGGLMAQGWFISQGNVKLEASFTAGAAISTNGNVTAEAFLYNPYFTRAFIYLPKQLKQGGPGIDDLPDFWANGADFKYGKTLDNGRTDLRALSIGRPSARLTAAGWRTK